MMMHRIALVVASLVLARPASAQILDSAACDLDTPCLNGATCIDIPRDESDSGSGDVAEFTCVCAPGFVGDVCESSTSPPPPPTHGGAPASMDDVFLATFTTQFGVDPEQLSEAEKVHVQQVVATDLEGQLGPHTVVGVVLRRVMIATANRRERRVVWRAADTKAVAYLNVSVSRGNLLRSLLNLREDPSTVTLADGTVLTGVSSIEGLYEETTTEAPTEDPGLASGSSSSDDDDNESIIIGLIIAIVVAIICGGGLAWRAMGGTSESTGKLDMPGPTPAIESGNDSYLAADDMVVGGGHHYYPGAPLSREPELNAITSRVQGKPPAGATPQALPETPGLLTFGSPAGSVAVGGFQPTTSRLSEVEDFN